MTVLTINQGSARYEHVVQLMNGRRFEEAIAAAKEWINSNSQNADAYGILAQIYLKSDQFHEALYWSEEALRYDAENTIAWFVRVSVLDAQGEDRELLKALNEAQRLDPYEGHYYFLKFNSHRKNGRLQEARQELDKALYMSPENSLYIASDSYLQAIWGNFEASLASEMCALQRNTGDDRTFLFLAWAAQSRGEHDKALEYLKDAIRMKPEDVHLRSEYMDTLGRSHPLYRVFLLPCFLKNIKTWQFVLLWVASWFIYKPLFIMLVVLYAAAHWTSPVIVRIKVYGWGSMFQKNV